MSSAPQLLLFQDTDDILSNGALDRADWLSAGLILAAAILLAFVISRTLSKLVARGVGDGFASVMIGRIASYIAIVLGFFYAFTALGVQVGPLLGALGIGGLIVALALQSLAESFVSSFIIQARRPYTIGESVELDGHTGVVLDIDARTTLLKAVNGTQVRIPNANVATSTIINLTREPVRRSSLDIGVAYDTNLEIAQEVIFQAIGRVPRILDMPSPAVYATGFNDSSIGLRVLYWHKSDIPSGLAAQTDLVFAIHQAFLASTITISFPQMVVWSGEQTQETPYPVEPKTMDLPFPGTGSDLPKLRKRRIAPNLRSSLRRPSND